MLEQYTLIVKVLKGALGILAFLLLFGILGAPLLLNNNDRVKIRNNVKEDSINEGSNEVLNPKLYGQDKNGKPYFIIAKRGTKINDTTLRLYDITGKFKTDGESKYYSLSANNGESEQNSNIIYLYSDVVISNQDAYRVSTQEITINYKELSALGNSEITIEGEKGNLHADSFEVLPGAEIYKFKGNIKVLIHQ